MKKITLLALTFMLLAHISVPWFVFITFSSIRRFPEVLGKSRNPEIQDGRHLAIMT